MIDAQIYAELVPLASTARVERWTRDLVACRYPMKVAEVAEIATLPDHTVSRVWLPDILRDALVEWQANHEAAYS